MKKIFTFAAAAAFVASSAVFAADNNSNNQNQQNQPQRQQQQSQQYNNNSSSANRNNNSSNSQAPEGYVLLEENTVMMMAREPQQHLVRAHEQLAANNPKAAAAELRLASAYLKMQAARPGGQDNDVLTHWQQELHQLAGRVQKGDVKINEVTDFSAGANYALAKYFDDRAQKELGEQNHQIRAGYDLQAAADCFEQALIWHATPSKQGQQAAPQETKAIADARAAADQLISAENFTSEQQQGAQPAAAKSEANNNQFNDVKQAADELNKSISGCADQFKNLGENQQKGS